MLDAVTVRRLPQRRERGAFTPLDLVKDHIVLKSVRANDVVVVLVLVAPDDSGGAIFLS
jgi:hypothetical protein